MIDIFQNGILWDNGAGAAKVLTTSFVAGEWQQVGINSHLLCSCTLAGTALTSLDLQVEVYNRIADVAYSLDVKAYDGAGIVLVEGAVFALSGANGTHGISIRLNPYTTFRVNARRTGGAVDSTLIMRAQAVAPVPLADGTGLANVPEDLHFFSGNGDPNASADADINAAIPGSFYQQLDTEPLVIWVKQASGATTWLVHPWSRLFAGATNPNVSADAQVQNAVAGSSCIQDVAASGPLTASKREWLKGTSGAAGKATWVPKNATRFAKIVYCDPSYTGGFSDGSPEYPYTDLKTILAAINEGGWTIVLASDYDVGGSPITWPDYLVSIQAKPGRGVAITNSSFATTTLQLTSTTSGARVNLFDLNIFGEVLYNTTLSSTSINFWSCFLYGRVRLASAGANPATARINFWRGSYAVGYSGGGTNFDTPIVIASANGSVIIQDNARIRGRNASGDKPAILISAANDNTLIHDSVVLNRNAYVPIKNASGSARSIESAHGRYNMDYASAGATAVNNLVATPYDVFDANITDR